MSMDKLSKYEKFMDRWISQNRKQTYDDMLEEASYYRND